MPRSTTRKTKQVSKKRYRMRSPSKKHHRKNSRRHLKGGDCGCGSPPLRSGLRLPKPNVGEAAALGLGTFALTGNPRAGLGLGLGSYYAGRLLNTE